jgi:hypothetical protein
MVIAGFARFSNFDLRFAIVDLPALSLVEVVRIERDRKSQTEIPKFLDFIDRLLATD